MRRDAHGNLSPRDAGRTLAVLGAGYTGGELVRQALARGWRVVALTRNASRAAALRGYGAECVIEDLAGERWHEQMPAALDLVVNCVSSGGSGAAGYRRSYLGGMESVAAWTRRSHIGTLVYTSSTSVYGQGAEPAAGATVPVIDETMPAEADGESAAILRETEAVLRGATAPRRVVLRLAGLYGPGRHHLLDRLRQGVTEFPGRGDHLLNLVHREDAVGAIWAAWERLPAGDAIYNVSDGHPAPKAEVVGWLAQRLGMPTPRFSGEESAGRRRAPRDRVISSARLRLELGWEPAYPDYRAGYGEILRAES